MAYHGLIKPMCQVLNAYKAPAVLEIGVSAGITYIPLLHHMLRQHKTFTLMGCDIDIKKSVYGIAGIMSQESNADQQMVLVRKNSLELFPYLIEKGFKFDMVFVDGDHNYYTVSKELEYINQLASEDPVIICDDYYGRWSEKDLFYSEREDQLENEIATPVQNTDKVGVKIAVDEFLKKYPEWKIFAPPFAPGEPIVLHKGFLDKFKWEKNE
jgi:predicted O-methyltransferase YrrM